MIKQRFAFLGLALSLGMFAAACEDKTEVVIPPEPDPPIVVNVVPDALTLEVGSTGQLVASVTGGNASTARTVTWASSNTAVATVNASGAVSAVAPGVATVSATSTADANAKDASAITVVAGAPDPTVSIKSITTFSTNIPVALNNVFGQIDITLNLDAPPGSQISALRTYIQKGTTSTKVCEQTFSGGSAEALVGDEAQGQVEIVCSVNTAMYTGTPGVDAAGTVTFANGPDYKIRAEIVRPGGTIGASIESQPMLFNNTNFIVAVRASPTHCVNSATTGLVWCEGDVVANLLPVMFSTPNGTVESIRVTASTGATFNDTDKSNGFKATLQKATTPAASSVANVENANVTFTVTSLTSGGQAGPTCINPDPVLNPQPACGVTANVNFWPFAVPFRLDNNAPVVTVFDLTPDSLPGLACNPLFPVPNIPDACYISELFNFNTTQTVKNGNFFTMTDGGVGSATVSFMAGPAGSLIPVTSGGSLAESVTSKAYIAQATTMDALENTRVVYASPTGGSQTTTTNAQTFGVDTTAPSPGPVAGVTNNSTNPAAAPPAWTFGPAIDFGVGPSGFLPNPYRVRTERHLPASVTCFLPDNAYAGNTTSCTTPTALPGYVADDGIVDVPTGVVAPAAAGVEGYWRVMSRAIDAAWPGNMSGDSTRVTLNDVTAPVVGGITAPASLPGGATHTFTAPLADNVDLRSISPFLTYANGVALAWPLVTLGAYGIDDGLVGSATGNFVVANFVRSLENTTAAGRANATVSGATTVTFDVRDVATNLTSASLGIAAAVNFAAPSGILPALGTAATGVPAVDSATFNPTNALHGNFIHLAPTNTQVCQGGSAACGASPPATTVVRATMTGPNATFANPFTSVNFYYQDPVNGRWYLIGTGTPAASDNTVTSTRTWTYSFTWNVTGLLASDGTPLVNPAVNLVAIGITASGSALASTGTPITIDITAT